MNLSKFGALIKVTEGTCSGWLRFRATNVDGRLRARVVKGAGVFLHQNHDTTRTRRHPRPFRPYSQEHARVLRVQCYPRFKNLSFGCKSLELCADVAPDVGIKAKLRVLRFL